jgi:hypothetical protein
MTVSDYPDWGTSQANADAISTTGVGLLKMTNDLEAINTGTIPGGTLETLATDIPVTQTAWEFGGIFYLPSGAGTVPFARFTLNWYESTGTILVAQDTLTVVSGNGSGNAIAFCGRGPTKGEILDITMRNLDPAQTLTYEYSVSQVSHTYDKPQWQQTSLPTTAPIGYTTAGGDLASSVNAYHKATIVPGTPNQSLLPVYFGKWRCFLDNSAGANGCTVQIQTLEGFGVPSGQNLYYGTVAAGAVLPFEFSSPSEPLLLVLTNNGGAGNIDPLFTSIIEPY